MNIHGFGYRNINVFDYRVLPKAPLGALSNMIYMLNYLPKNPKNSEFGNSSSLWIRDYELTLHKIPTGRCYLHFKDNKQISRC